MPINPNNPSQLARLRTSIRWSRERLRRFRVNYKRLVEQFVTENYSDRYGTTAEVLINMLGLAVDVNVLHLAPSQPQVLITSDYPEYGPTAHSFEIAINADFKQMDMETVFREVAMDAWFAVGIVKIFLAEGNPREFYDQLIDVGELKVESVSLDNWVHDCRSRKFNNCAYFGDCREERLYDIQTSELYSNTDKLTPVSGNSQYDEFGEEPVGELTTEGAADDESTPVDMVKLWDIFLPREQLLITLPDDRHNQSGPVYPLRVVDWQGPKHGPYHLLSLLDVPENVMPTSPGMQLQNMHELANSLLRKLRDQARRQKNVTAVASSADGDAKVYRDAADGDLIRVADMQNINEVRAGGIDAQNHGFAVWLMQQFDQHAGNLQLLGGLSPSAGTLGQEELLMQQNSARMQKQKGKMHKLVRAVAKDIAWYRWHDQFFDPPVTKTLPGMEYIKAKGSFHPLDRLGGFIDYNLEIEPHSLEYMPPAKKLAVLQQVLGQTILPMMPIMMEQGLMLNMEHIIKLISRYANLPELVDSIIFAKGETEPRPEGKSPDSVMRPPVTTRQNVRVNRPGATHQDQNDLLARQLMGGGNGMQQTETNAAYRGG
jgi:hypothetical protein